MNLWRGSTPVVAATDRVTAALDALSWDGLVLPKVQLSGGAVYPVIAWTSAAYQRNTEGPKPILCRPTLAAWEADGPKSAVRVVGFLHAASPAEGIGRLKAVAAYGPGAIVVAHASRMGRWTMSEADMAGISVVEARVGGTTNVVLRGRDAPLPTARRTVATRLREEQLYEWALHVGIQPTYVRSPSPPVAMQRLVS
jgi:hypothetical protein